MARKLLKAWLRLFILYESCVMKNLTAATFCAGVLYFSGVLLAQTVSQAPSYPAADVGAFHGDQKTLTSAIRTIQQSTGGKVVEIRFADGPPSFHAAVAHGGNVQFVLLDQSSGKVAPVSSRPDWALKWQQKTAVKLAKSATVSLSQAIATAEGFKHAPAIAAGIARSASDPTSEVHAYNVLLVDGGSVKRIAVDSSTGQIIQDPGALESWP
jgi:uncharacterized membrane protein YkoI